MDSIQPPGDVEKSRIKRVLIKGFEATSIYPFNPNKVLQKFPSFNEENVGKMINDT